MLAVQVRVLMGEQRGPAAVVEHVEQAAGHHDPAGRAGQRVGLDGVPGHHDDAPPGAMRAARRYDSASARARARITTATATAGRGQQQRRGHPATAGTGSPRRSTG